MQPPLGLGTGLRRAEAPAGRPLPGKAHDPVAAFGELTGMGELILVPFWMIRPDALDRSLPFIYRPILPCIAVTLVSIAAHADSRHQPEPVQESWLG